MAENMAQSKEDKFQTILSLSRDLLNVSTLDNLLQKINATALGVVDAGTSALWYCVPEATSSLFYRYGILNAPPMTADFVERLFGSRPVIRLSEAEFLGQPFVRESPLSVLESRDLLGVRILSQQGTTLGVILVGDKFGSRNFTPADEKLLLHLASIAALALNHVAAKEEAEQRTRQQEQTEKRLQMAMQAANEGVWEIDLVTGDIWVSDSFARMFNPPSDPASFLEWWEASVYSEDLPAAAASFKKAVEDPKKTLWCCQYRFRLSSGDYADIDDRATILRDKDGVALKVIGAMHDITALRTAEKGLRESEQLYRAVVNNIHDAILIIDRRMSFMVANKAYMKLHGLSELPSGKEFNNRYRMTLPDGRSLQRRDWPLIKALKGQRVSNVEMRVHDRCRDTYWVGSYSFIPISDEQGDVVQMVVTIHDVTEIRQAFALVEREVQRRTNQLAATVEALRASEETYVLSIKAMNAAVWEWKQGERRRPSPECKALIGYGPSEIEDVDWPLNFAHPDDADRMLAYFSRYVDGMIDGPYEQTFRLRHKDGTYRWILSRAAAVTGVGGRVVRLVGTHSDITEKIAVDRQLQHAQKMDSVGLLAGGIAHDFNNLLTVILGYSEQLSDLAPTHEMRETSKEILEAAMRAQALTKKLLTFSRQQVMTLKPVDLGETVMSTIKFLARVIGEDINVVVDNAPGDAYILGDAAQLEQVVSNIILNARDAMEGGGTLHVSTRVVDVDSAFAARIGVERRGTYAAVTIKDTGRGVPEEYRSRIFEPFFTTKEVGKGTGLGLSIAFGIVKQHHGMIVVESELEVGSTFTIYLPSSGRRSAAKEDVPAEVAAPSGEHILVVEDEEIVRNLMKILLQVAGYVVETAEDGKEALYVLEHQPIDLVISDVLMPRMNGKELYHETRRRFPCTQFIFMSGYPSDLLTDKGLSDEHVVFIQKPIKRDHLLQKVRECLLNGDRCLQSKGIQLG